MSLVISQKEKDRVLSKVGSNLTVTQRGEGEEKWSFENGILRIGDYFPVVNFDTESTVELVHHKDLTETVLWKTDDSGRIYIVLPDGSKRYLWVLSKVVYVTPDALIASQFDFEKATPEEHNETKKVESWVLILLFLLIALGVVYFAKK